MKTVCIYHSVDEDGWMSTAIVKHWFITKYQDGEVIKVGEEPKFKYELPTLTMLGYNYGESIPDLSEYNKVIMCDISFPAENMWQIQNKVGYENFAWIDHHISAMNNTDSYYRSNALGHIGGLRDTKFAACELTWKYFFSDETMPEIVRLLGRYDCFGHKGTNEEQKILEFQYAARAYITNYEDAYSYLTKALDQIKGSIIRLDYDTSYLLNLGKGIYKYLCTEAKQVYKNGFKINLVEEVIAPRETQKQTEQPTMFKPRKFICINRERFNPINFGIDYHKDGYDGCACFWYADGKWKFSLYNDNGEVDCSTIAKSFGGGGHKGAAGFVIDDLDKIIK